jgi:predicted ATP-dependent endonuclease of OLD family
MKIKSFRIQKYRHIQDSGEVSLYGPLTCIVGKNQSGKTALLRALHKFNPHNSSPYDLRKDWPRGERKQKTPHQIVCTIKFQLNDEEINTLKSIAETELNTDIIAISKDYDGNFEIIFPEQPDLFPEKLHPNEIDNICEEFPTPPNPVGDNFLNEFNKCVAEVRKLAKEGLYSDLAALQDKHDAAMRSSFTPGNPEPQHTHENQFIVTYQAKLQEMTGQISSKPTLHHRAHEYLIKRIPTFIYMDDYKEFQGTAILDQMLQRRNSNQLSNTDETFLMILELAGLSLEELIQQGDSGDQTIIRERQQDLDDAARSLTNSVAGRWGQNPYRIEFRADGQQFFTEIEEVNNNVGMIPLEEQSKGFRWFFSFDLHFMHDSNGTFEGCVLLLDEPGLHLHPGAQEDLLKRLDAYANSNTLIYTTHLPFLVDLREPSRIRVIQQFEGGAVVSEDLSSTQKDERMTLQAALGMKMNQNYLIAEKNLIVEGAHDYWLLSALSSVFERAGKDGIDPEVMITSASSASEIVHTAIFMIGQELSVVALFDSDPEGIEQEGKLRKNWLTRYKNSKSKTILLGEVCNADNDIFTIENLFPEKYYIDMMLASHKDKLKNTKINLTAKEIIGMPLLTKCEAALSAVGVSFNKGSVAKAIRTDLVKTTYEELPDGVADKCEKLFAEINSNFKQETSKPNHSAHIASSKH